MSIYHKHHIVPRHAGGTDDPENIIQLTITEHAEAHRLLWEKYGHPYDYTAWRGLAKMINKEQAIKEIQIETGRMNGLASKGRKHSEETKAKIKVRISELHFQYKLYRKGRIKGSLNKHRRPTNPGKGIGTGNQKTTSRLVSCRFCKRRVTVPSLGRYHANCV